MSTSPPHNDERTEQLERQAAALEDLAEQIEIQNAVLLELVHAQHRRLCVDMGKDPDRYSRESQTGFVQDNVMDLFERVDVDTARLYADE